MRLTLDGFGSKRQLGTILSDAGILTAEMLDLALSAQRSSDQRERLGTILVKLGLVSPSQLAWALSRQMPIVRPFGAGI